jgi:hypothetical protein
MATITNPMNQNPSVNQSTANQGGITMNQNTQNQIAQPQDANLDWRNKLQPDILKKVEETENAHFWAGTIIGAITVGVIATIFDRR